MFKKLWPMLLGALSSLAGTWTVLIDKQEVYNHLTKIEEKLETIEDQLKEIKCR